MPEEQDCGSEEDLPWLDGEDPGTPYPEDIEHWIAVYEELVSFCDSVLATSARPSADAAEAHLIRRRRDAAGRRLNYWRTRLTGHVEPRDRPGGERP
ncbi:MAG: hypothetical protein J2P42_08300 [Candidatus Dormibacteraeota bacterium]|nr:hypothetical protein [Candidatus Dormibacteraeota bacterium]